VLDRALSRVADHPVVTVCAGRTDAGVHALSQVVHFETHAKRQAEAWTFGVNANLPRDVSVTWSRAVPNEFHARFSASARRYAYFILNRRARPGMLNGRIAWERHPLDVDSMKLGASVLEGTHDFSAFRAAGCQARSPVRTVYTLSLDRQGDLIRIDISANAYLQRMVRNIAGVLIEIGRGQRPPAWASDVLAARDRREGGFTAPSNGLYLVGVRYPMRYDLPSEPALSQVCGPLGL